MQWQTFLHESYGLQKQSNERGQEPIVIMSIRMRDSTYSLVTPFGFELPSLVIQRLKGKPVLS